MKSPAQQHERPRLLMMAHECSPYRGSEAGMGWNFALQAARYCDTWVLCEQHKWAADIRRYLDTHGEGATPRFVFVPEVPWAPLAWRIPGAGYLAYNLWQRRALRAARQLHEQVHFDLVHHVNVIGFREPGYLWKLGVPTIWGPVGGTQNYPWRFLGEAGVRGAIFETARTLANRCQLRFSRRVRRACRQADLLLTANSTGRRDFARAHGVEPIQMLETGIVEVHADTNTQRPPHDGLRILWCGGLQPWKALSLLIKALARLPENVGYEVRVVGDGPLRGRYQRLARRLGVDRHIQWLGQMPHRETLRQYSWADVFVFTSLRDTSGNVVLEALGAGVPVVCLDHQGVHDMVTDRCGVKIPVTTPDEVIGRLSEAITVLGRDPARRQKLGQGALNRVNDYLWSRRGKRMASLYRKVLGDGFLWQPTEELSHA